MRIAARTASPARKLAWAFRPVSQTGFTMVEIALCLAIIGFALVAIIAALSTGLGVQTDNRQETVINQDAAVWIDAIRNGSMGYDDLTNYVVSVTNYWTRYAMEPDRPLMVFSSGEDTYTRTSSRVSSVPGPANSLALINGYRIVGVLSTPSFVPPPASLPPGGGIFQSNYVVAYVRAISGAASEKPPQSNVEVLDNGFVYRMIVDNAPLALYTSPTNSSPLVNSTLANSRELRLTFRFPVILGPAGAKQRIPGRLSFRTLAGGSVTNIIEPNGRQTPLFFYQPSIYASQ